jgi:hypothetical protein
VQADASWADSGVDISTSNVPFKEIRSPSGSGFRFAAEAVAKVVHKRNFDAVSRAVSASLDIAATL